MSEATTTLVRTASGESYPVLVGRGILTDLAGLLEERARAHRYAVISDDTVASLYGEPVTSALRDAGLAAELFSFPAGEENKTRDRWSALTDGLLERGFGRDTAVVAVGGGVTGDLAGFVAATFMRGVPLVQVPTSLVAMVDASVGGKTGVDTPVGKNLVGAFHPPRFVLADVSTTETLPREERAQGLAEAVKHGAILDEAYFGELAASSEALLDGDRDATQAAVARSVGIKARVVSDDEKEAGLRQILNFGHTLGHALEAASGYRLRHGSAVALGMVLECRLGEAMDVTESGTAERLAGALEALGLPGDEPSPGFYTMGAEGGPSTVRILEFMGSDKKARSGAPRFVLLSRIGQVDRGEGWAHHVPEDQLRRLLSETRRPGGAVG